jgi:hypothetical protein
MNSTIVPTGTAVLPGQVHDLNLEDLDDVRLTGSTVRAPAALQSAIPALSMHADPLPAWRKAAGPTAEHKHATTSLASVVSRASAVSLVAGAALLKLSHFPSAAASAQRVTMTSMFHRTPEEALIDWFLAR